MTAQRFACVARLDGRDSTFYWDTDEDTGDRVVFTNDGTLRVEPDEPTRYELDTIDAWCRSADTVGDCRALLSAWNLFGDLPRTDVYAAADAPATPLYDKLFHGCNLPAMKQDGEPAYVPSWSEAELRQLKQILLLGLAQLRAGLVDAIR